MMFYETAAQAIGDTVSGRDLLIGPVGGRGEAVDQSSGLESRFMGEIARMAAELDFEKANEVVGKVYEKYSERFANPPAGKPFNECHTVTSEYAAEPTEEYRDLFHSIIAEIAQYCA
jgi:methylamine--corrinoid protein Co-methyltransferase